MPYGIPVLRIKKTVSKPYTGSTVQRYTVVLITATYLNISVSALHRAGLPTTRCCSNLNEGPLVVSGLLRVLLDVLVDWFDGRTELQKDGQIGRVVGAELG